MLSRTLPTLITVLLGLICLFVFFAMLGLFEPGEVLWLSIATVGVVAICAAYTLWVRRKLGTHGNQEWFRSVNVLRERRGF